MTRSATVAATCLAVLAGCGGDEKRDAIDAFFARARASMLTGATQLDASLFASPPATPDEGANPVAYPPPASRTVALGTAHPSDGTPGMEVTAAQQFTPNPDGTGVIHATVTETATGFRFLDYSATVGKPDITYRIPSWGLKALKADGTGQAFIILSIKASGSVTRTYTNVNPANGHRLINFGAGAAPSGTATGQGAGVNEILSEMVLSRASGKLVARIGKQSSPFKAAIQFGRAGGPATTALTLNFTKLTVGGIAVAGPDFTVGVGHDLPGGAAVAGNATVDLAFTTAGGVSGFPASGGGSGPFAAHGFQFPPNAFTGPMDGLDGLNDGAVQVDRSVGIFLSSFEDVPQLDHSINDDDVPVGLAQAVVLSSFAIGGQTVVVAR